MKKILSIFLIGGSALLFNACTKSGALTGSSSSGSSSFGTISGSANGGLSPISGGAVNLFLGGSATPVASAITASDGSFSLTFNGQTSGNFLYLTITGGNAGSGTNSKNQLMAIVGTGNAAQSSLKVNEMSTAATELVGFNMGLLNDSNGTITLNAPKGNSASNVITQFNNLIANGNLNTSNSNLTTSAKTGLAVMANAFAACIENSSNCSNLFNNAQTSSGTSALDVLESGYYALLNSSGNSSNLYTLAFPFNSNTGFSLTSSSMPGGFTFNNPLAVSTTTVGVGAKPYGIAVDSSGNVWVANLNGRSITKISPAGAVLGTFSMPNNARPQYLSIDASGNIWVVSVDAPHGAAVFSPDGTVIGSYSIPGWTIAQGIAIDPAGNVWLSEGSASPSSIAKLNSSGTVLATLTSSLLNDPIKMTVDASGNVWAINGADTNINKLSSSLSIITTVSAGNASRSVLSVDSSGNLWVEANSNSNVYEFSSGGGLLNTFTGTAAYGGADDIAFDSSGNLWLSTNANSLINMTPAGVITAVYSLLGSGTAGRSIAIDSSGNLWGALQTSDDTTVIEYQGIANGPQVFPYSGPQYPF